MANIVKNIVKMSKITTLPLFAEKTAYGGRTVTVFDFNRIIPMPASLNMESGSFEYFAMEAAFRKDAVLRYKFSQLKSIPEMSDRDYAMRLAMYDKSEAILCQIGRQYIDNQIRYGATTWYEWCTKNWGTKWNAGETRLLDADTIMFDTPWSAPEKVIAQLAKMYPDIEVEHWWADEDMGYNAGRARYVGGKMLEQLCHIPCSNEAYEAYILCWGESECLYQDETGAWKHRNCDECHGCD